MKYYVCSTIIQKYYPYQSDILNLLKSCCYPEVILESFSFSWQNPPNNNLSLKFMPKDYGVYHKIDKDVFLKKIHWVKKQEYIQNEYYAYICGTNKDDYVFVGYLDNYDDEIHIRKTYYYNKEKILNEWQIRKIIESKGLHDVIGTIIDIDTEKNIFIVEIDI